MSRWWRAYDEAVDDPKLILLSDKAHRAWFALMCVASANGGSLPDIKIVAVKLRMSPQRAAAAITELVGAGLLDRREDGTFEPHNWTGRQYKSDVTDGTAAQRMQRYRERHRNDRNATVTVTPPREQKTDTDTETSLRSERARASRLPDDWAPIGEDIAFAISKGLGMAQIEIEAVKFRNYWTSKGGKDATKTSWPRTWQNWILNAKGLRGGETYPAKPLTQHQRDREESKEILNDLQKFIDASDNRGDSDASFGPLRFGPGDRQESVHGGVRGDVVVIPPARLGKGG